MWFRIFWVTVCITTEEEVSNSFDEQELYEVVFIRL